MSKNKGKNSNYKNNISTEKVETKENKLSPEMTKKIIIYSVCAVLAIALIVGIVLLTRPKEFSLIDLGEAPETSYVEMDFGKYGKVIIKVDGEEAPETARNFRNLVASGFYDGLTIFRAQRGFVVQGGEDKNIPLTPIKGEFDSNGHINNISHKRGVISMARTGEPNSATSQFFITLNDSAASSLDGEYAGFGWVVEGMDVIDAIAADLYGHAINYMGFVEDKNAIKIKSASIIEYEE
jgi:peptidyl-prolyl cis-trans isomerase B (cyclophilin B)